MSAGPFRLPENPVFRLLSREPGAEPPSFRLRLFTSREQPAAAPAAPASDYSCGGAWTPAGWPSLTMHGLFIPDDESWEELRAALWSLALASRDPGNPARYPFIEALAAHGVLGDPPQEESRA